MNALYTGTGILITYDVTASRWAARVLPDPNLPTLYTDICYADTPAQALTDALAAASEGDEEGS